MTISQITINKVSTLKNKTQIIQSSDMGNIRIATIQTLSLRAGQKIVNQDDKFILYDGSLGGVEIDTESVLDFIDGNKDNLTVEYLVEEVKDEK